MYFSIQNGLRRSYLHSEGTVRGLAASDAQREHSDRGNDEDSFHVRLLVNTNCIEI